MEFLIDANVSYVLLILGFLFAILALFSPGTGIMEVGALIALVLAGYGIINLPLNTWALAILAFSLIPFGLAVRARKGRTRLLFLSGSVLAFLVGSALLFPWNGLQPGVSPVLIALLSTLALGLAWLMATKSVEAIDARPSFDLDRLVGMTGEASSDIRSEGTVYVNGETWSAHSKTFIPAGSPVRVVRRDGFTLEVENASS